MPAGVHRRKARTFRPDPAVYERAQEAVASMDSDMNTYINAFLEWLVHDSDALPERPAKAGQASA
ncbi:hypothetical protein [Streptomyces sp. NPDC047972]|uniref:hypothetical protein n=1 Tax=Streptomyces sp. NPDC047972 TaxID=3365493 RepID=UPI00371FAD9B